MVDVTVMGAGIFGLSVAYACQMRGAKVRVIDDVAVGAGSSGGLVGALAPHTPHRWDAVKIFQLESLLMAQDHWRMVDELSGVSSGYGRIGRLQPIPTPRMLALSQERHEDAKTMWRGRAQWSVVASDAFGAWAPKSKTGFLVHDTLSARMRPRGAAHSLAGAIVALGGEVLFGDHKPLGKVVWATGYRGLLALSREFGFEVGNGVKGQSAILEYDAGEVPQLFANSLYVVPHSNGTLAVGSTSERSFDVPDQVDQNLDELLGRVFTQFPFLAKAKVLEKWAGVRPRSNTMAPMLGKYPGKDGQFIVNGGFKTGFGMAPKIGAAMADLVLEGDSTAIPDTFAVKAVFARNV